MTWEKKGREEEIHVLNKTKKNKKKKEEKATENFKKISNN